MSSAREKRPLVGLPTAGAALRRDTMYSNFFGFKERPFKLLPDPTYLFLSKGHEEALAHLKYTVEHGDGFVEITGEVGTGKTTLCRVFLDRLSEDTEAAYIFNRLLPPEDFCEFFDYKLLNISGPVKVGKS